MPDETFTKVHVDLPHHWGAGGESIWAAELGADRYRIENVPFYAYDLNFHDIVEARAAAPELKPAVSRVVARSGHRTLRVLFDESVARADQELHLATLAPLHVSYERANARYIALDLEPDADLDRVRERLDEFEAAGVLSYETCEARVADSFDDVPESAEGEV